MQLAAPQHVCEDSVLFLRDQVDLEYDLQREGHW
jgi:hypothetical protein